MTLLKLRRLDLATMVRSILCADTLSMEPDMVELTLPTMTCGHCVRTVTATVAKVDDKAKLEVDLPSHKVRIESAKPSQDFVAALSDEGYAPA
jgi:copper chaperone